jgi:hypothetical protein
MLKDCPTSVRAAALLLLAIIGCGPTIPRTYPVKGKVVWKGGKPVNDGRIEFRSLADEELKAIGEIERDGTFTLVTHKGGRTRAGAVAGQHRVVVEPDLGPRAPPQVVTLPKPYTVEPRENDFTIEITPRRR